MKRTETRKKAHDINLVRKFATKVSRFFGTAGILGIQVSARELNTSSRWTAGSNCSPPSWGWGCGEDVLDGGEGVEAVSGCGCDGGSDAGVEVGRPARAEAAGDFAIGRGGAQGPLG